MPEKMLLKANTDLAYVCHRDPLIYYQDNFISPVECQYIIDIAKDQLQRAKVSLDDESSIIDARSGSNCWLRYDSDSTVRSIGQRIANYLGLPLENAEALQVIHYKPHQEYRAHFDAYDLTTVVGKRCCKFGGQRLVTALIYLNEVTKGGETGFPKLNLDVKPAAGRIIVFHNTDVDSNTPHPLSLHAGMPVIEGEKWAFNMWFHAEPMTSAIDFDKYSSPEIGFTEVLLSPRPTDWLTFRLNRARPLLEKCLDTLKSQAPKGKLPVCFTYWDTFGNSQLNTDDIAAGTRIISLIPREITNPLADKKAFPKLLSRHSKASLSPITCYTTAEAEHEGGEKSDIWFAKNAYGTGGEGMYCLSGDELGRSTLEKDYVLQKGVTDLALIDGRKFTARIYCLIWNGGLYLYREGFVVINGVPYDPASKDYRVQIDHSGFHIEGGPVSMAPLSGYDKYNGYFEKCVKLVEQLAKPFDNVIAASSADTYLFLGLDLLFQQSGDIKLIEVNTMPNFIHTPSINEQVNLPFFLDAIGLMLGHSAGDLIRCN